MSSDKNINENLVKVREVIKNFPKFLGDAKEEYLMEFHKQFIKKYHDVESYLLTTGLHVNEIENIKRKLLGEEYVR
jgi:hypothetical protein